MVPVLDEVAEEYRDRLRVVKVNVEQEPQTIQVAAQGLYRIEFLGLV